jgi:hypothetical protein
MFERLTERFRAWRTGTLEREAARRHVIRAARALAAKISKFEEMGTEHRILVEALEHLDALGADE